MFALDKQAHFWAGMAIASACVAYSTAPWAAFVFTVMVAAGKEVWDKVSGTGTMDFWDFVATALGAAAVLPLEVI
jgi:hypothetical protein